MLRILLLGLCILTAAASNATAAGNVSSAKTDFSDLAHDYKTAPITKIVDPQTLLAKDGTIYRLAGIDVPDTFLQAAQKRVIELAEGKDLRLYQTKSRDMGRLNKLGQSIVHAETKQGDAWIQGVLVAEGLARVRTTPENPEMAHALLSLEDRARQEKRGLWNDSQFAVIDANKPPPRLSGYHIAEGIVRAIGTANNRVFINFGTDWRTDFTIVIEPVQRRQLAKGGLNPQLWTGRRLRVHGWVDDINGPSVLLTHPQQIELIDDGKITVQNPMAPAVQTGMGYIKAPEKPKTPDVEPQRKQDDKPVFKTNP